MTKEIAQKIIETLPYGKDFLFVDNISYVDSEKIIGNYTFKKDALFYQSHFKHKPVTPGVILVEMMGQIGLICHYIYIQELYNNNDKFYPILSHIEAEFFEQIFPDEKITISSKKIYFRNGILKSKVEVHNIEKRICCNLVAQVKFEHE